MFALLQRVFDLCLDAAPLFLDASVLFLVLDQLALQGRGILNVDDDVLAELFHIEWLSAAELL